MKATHSEHPGGTPASPEHATAPAERRSQRLAWTVIVTAFAAWCLLVAVGGWSARRYVLTAALPQPAILEISRGVAFYSDRLTPVQARASNGMALQEGAQLETGELTEAQLMLYDGSVLHLFPSTTVTLDALRVGRFTESATEVQLSQVHGVARYTVAGSLPNDAGITLSTPHAQLALQRGEYLVWVRDDGTSVSAYAGKGSVHVGDRLERFRYGQRIRVLANGQVESPGPLPENLVANGAFTAGLDGWQPVDVQEKGRKDVPGVRALVPLVLNGDDIQGLRVTRDTVKDTHNETGVLWKIDREVLPYRNLYIRAWVRVDSASLSGGGYAGSEYPMMLQVDYVDATGGRPGWSHGFFYSNPDSLPVINAELVTQGEWLYYQGNLTELKERPAYVSSLRVIGSGHDFDSTVTAIELVAE